MSRPSTVRFLGFEDSAVAAVTTTHGGHSEGPYATLNMSYRVGDDPSRVTANLDLAGRALDIKRSALVIPQLAHGCDVAIVTSADAGRGAYDAESNIPSTDALVTDVSGLPLAVLVADCAPVLLHDPRRGVAGPTPDGVGRYSVSSEPRSRLWPDSTGRTRPTCASELARASGGRASRWVTWRPPCARKPFRPDRTSWPTETVGPS